MFVNGGPCLVRDRIFATLVASGRLSVRGSRLVNTGS